MIILRCPRQSCRSHNIIPGPWKFIFHCADCGHDWQLYEIVFSQLQKGDTGEDLHRSDITTIQKTSVAV